MPTLQVPLTEEEMAVLKGAADYRGMKLRALVTAWVGAGCPLADGPSNGKAMASNAEAMPVTTTEHLELARRQVELLERLVSLQESQATPHGGPSSGAAFETASEDAPRHSRFRVDSSNPFGSGVTAAPMVSVERDLEAIKPLVAGKWLVAEEGWSPFQRSVRVSIELADGSVLKAKAKGMTAALVSVDHPEGGWPGGVGNAGLSRVVAPIEAVEFEEEPAAIDADAKEEEGTK